MSLITRSKLQLLSAADCVGGVAAEGVQGGGTDTPPPSLTPCHTLFRAGLDTEFEGKSWDNSFKGTGWRYFNAFLTYLDRPMTGYEPYMVLINFHRPL
jgi:hypothetical protein